MSANPNRWLRHPWPPGRWMLALVLALAVIGVSQRDVNAQVNPLRARTSANFGASTSYQDIPGLTWYVAANTSYAFACRLAYTVTGGLAPTSAELFLSVNGPASPTALRYTVTTATSSTSVGSVSQTSYNTDPNHSGSGGSTALPAVIRGTFENGPNAGTFAIRALTNSIAGSTANILRGSFCNVYRQ
jgi:hypothetical protein